MNRSGAKLLSAIGIFVSLASPVLFISGLARRSDYSQWLAPVFFVGGVALIIFSLAYYTEK